VSAPARADDPSAVDAAFLLAAAHLSPVTDRARSEPATNIAGGVDHEALPPAEETATRAAAVVEALGELYWRSAYGELDAFECLVRTVLSQTTTDEASQAAHDALLAAAEERGWTPDDGSDPDLAAALLDLPREAVVDAVAPAGLAGQKADRIRRAAETVRESFGSTAAFDEFVADADPETVRERLAAIRGVGPKTADCVLLFAGGREGIFPVDTHVHRVARRLGIAPADADPEGVRAALEAAVPPERCGFGHTTTLQFGRDYCTARSPVCLDDPGACPLADRCDRVGVDPDAGTVADPADAEG